MRLEPRLLIVALLAGCGASAGHPTAAMDASGVGGAAMMDAALDIAGSDVAGDTASSDATADGADRNGSDGGDAADGPVGIGQECNFSCSSPVCGTTDNGCPSGYCVYDSQYVRRSYCTALCGTSNPACPTGYTCVVDSFTSQHWCLKPAPPQPTDLGAPCPSSMSTTWCELSQNDGPKSFCTGVSTTCMAPRCAHDPVSKTDYCSALCNPSRFPCPTGYDCRQSPRFADGYLCTIHHAPMEYLGVFCSAGTALCVGGGTCPTRETWHTCDPNGGICLQEAAGSPDRADYCTYRCETTPCPDGYVCRMFTIDPAGAPSGQYCVRASALSPTP